MFDMSSLLVLALAFGWVGHACIWTAFLNNLYGRAWPKGLLRVWRHATALILLAYPLLIWSSFRGDDSFPDWQRNGAWGEIVSIYLAICLVYGLVVFPVITVARAIRKPPRVVLAEQTRTLDLWSELGPRLIGDNPVAAMTRLPGNGVFRVDFTELTLGLVGLPPQWDGLTILALSDVHFHGSPSQLFFERIVDELARGPLPDLVCLLGDFLDSDRHRAWIEPLLGRLQAREAKLAILGNHDFLHHPDQIRKALANAGYTVLGNGWRELTIRNVPCLAIGHEGPWFKPEPDLSTAPDGPFRICLSHTPDNFYWGQANHINLMLCGHVHGGAIRFPVIGPIFVPSIYGRRFDSGVFEGAAGTAMVVSRGLSGKEPLRIRCNPQVIRLTLRVAPTRKSPDALSTP